MISSKKTAEKVRIRFCRVEILRYSGFIQMSEMYAYRISLHCGTLSGCPVARGMAKSLDPFWLSPPFPQNSTIAFRLSPICTISILVYDPNAHQFWIEGPDIARFRSSAGGEFVLRCGRIHFILDMPGSFFKGLCCSFGSVNLELLVQPFEILPFLWSLRNRTPLRVQ